MAIENSFWNGKKVLITGHTGFKGSWLALWLSSLGAKVTGIALLPDTSPNLFYSANIDELVTSHFLDINCEADLRVLVNDIQPDIVFHLAAQALVRESYVSPVQTFQTNVMGTINVLEASRAVASVKSVVVITTDKCYQNNEWTWGYREIDRLGGHDPYSASKACAELAVESWRLSFMGGQSRCAVATARAGNVVGGGDWSKDRLVPDLLKAIVDEKDLTLRNPDAIRPWQHVLEPLSGYLMLAEKLFVEGQQWAKAWNFGPDDSDAQKVSWLVERLISKFGSSSKWVKDPLVQPHEARYLKLDCSLAKQDLGWAPVWNLDQCLSNIVDWEQSFSKGDNMRSVSLRAIESYQREKDLLHR